MPSLLSALLLAVLLVLLAVLIYRVARDPEWKTRSAWLANYVETPHQVLRRSRGTLDAAAHLAFQRATGRGQPSAEEHALAAAVLTHNVLGQEHRPARDASGAPTPAAIARARERARALETARAHHRAALEGLGAPRAVARPTGRLGRNLETLRGFLGPPPAALPPAQIVDQATHFAWAGLGTLLDNDPIIAELVAAQARNGGDLVVFADGPDRFVMRLDAVDAPLAAAADAKRGELVRLRQASAATAVGAAGGARGAGVAAYVGAATAHTSDPQNSHDTGVLACQRAIVARLRADQGGAPLPSVEAIIAEIRRLGPALSDNRPPRVELAVQAAERTLRGERVVAVGATDGECLSRVWLRADDPRNARAPLRQAVFDALVDCWEQGLSGPHIVCVNGRLSRILGALATLDFDARNTSVKRLEQFKNDIFARAAAVIRETAQAATAAEDPDLVRAGRSFLATTAAEYDGVGDVPEKAVEALQGLMRAAIVTMVDQYVLEVASDGVPDAIPPHLVEAVKVEALGAV